MFVGSTDLPAGNGVARVAGILPGIGGVYTDSEDSDSSSSDSDIDTDLLKKPSDCSGQKILESGNKPR